jgi:hypothetical protein
VLGSLRALEENTMTGRYDEPCILLHPAVESVRLRGIIFRTLMAVDGLTWHEAEDRLERLDMGLAFSLREAEAVEPRVRLFGLNRADKDHIKFREYIDLLDQAGTTGPDGWFGIGSSGGSIGGVTIALIVICALLALS